MLMSCVVDKPCAISPMNSHMGSRCNWGPVTFVTHLTHWWTDPHDPWPTDPVSSAADISWVCRQQLQTSRRVVVYSLPHGNLSVTARPTFCSLDAFSDQQPGGLMANTSERNGRLDNIMPTHLAEMGDKFDSLVNDFWHYKNNNTGFSFSLFYNFFFNIAVAGILGFQRNSNITDSVHNTMSGPVSTGTDDCLPGGYTVSRGYVTGQLGKLSLASLRGR